MELPKNPMQPMIYDIQGTVRFKENTIVSYLLHAGSIDLNMLSVMDFPKNDWEQFYQLIGYSFGGYSELQRIDDDAYNEARIQEELLIKRSQGTESTISETIEELEDKLSDAYETIFNLESSNDLENDTNMSDEEFFEIINNIEVPKTTANVAGEWNPKIEIITEEEDGCIKSEYTSLRTGEVLLRVMFTVGSEDSHTHWLNMKILSQTKKFIRKPGEKVLSYTTPEGISVTSYEQPGLIIESGNHMEIYLRGENSEANEKETKRYFVSAMIRNSVLGQIQTALSSWAHSMTNMPDFDLEQTMTLYNGTCKTRHGKDARIICTDANIGQGFSVVALVKLHDDNWETPLIYDNEGKFYSETSPANAWDLITL